MPVPGYNAVIDISHYSTVTNWTSVKNAGIAAVIHKATEGQTYHDKEYHKRKAQALSAGFLWGSYHYTSGAVPLRQVENYLDYAQPTPGELVAIDVEPSSSGINITLPQLIELITLFRSATGRLPVIYGGDFLRGLTASADASDLELLAGCPLWYARYTSNPIGLPRPWQEWLLWQYSDGNAGPEPQKVPGIGNCDRNTFSGTEADFKARWPLS